MVSVFLFFTFFSDTNFNPCICVHMCLIQDGGKRLGYFFQLQISLSLFIIFVIIYHICHCLLYLPFIIFVNIYYICQYLSYLSLFIIFVIIYYICQYLLDLSLFIRFVIIYYICHYLLYSLFIIFVIYFICYYLLYLSLFVLCHDQESLQSYSNFSVNKVFNIHCLSFNRMNFLTDWLNSEKCKRNNI